MAPFAHNDRDRLIYVMWRPGENGARETCKCLIVGTRLTITGRGDEK